jgi:hypothetical protein
MTCLNHKYLGIHPIREQQASRGDYFSAATDTWAEYAKPLQTPMTKCGRYSLGINGS